MIQLLRTGVQARSEKGAWLPASRPREPPEGSWGQSLRRPLPGTAKRGEQNSLDLYSFLRPGWETWGGREQQGLVTL